MTASSPGTSRFCRTERVLPTDEEYLLALADAMREEYQAIVDAGFILQIDDPRCSRRLRLHGPRHERSRTTASASRCASRR